MNTLQHQQSPQALTRLSALLIRSLQFHVASALSMTSSSIYSHLSVDASYQRFNKKPDMHAYKSQK